MTIRTLLVLTLLLLAATLQPANADAPPLPRIAILDSGLRATHQEFTPDQVVAWWDFTDDTSPLHRPSAGATWDPIVQAPYDPRGHGTSVSALAAGNNADDWKVPSHCPGCPLVIGKVIDSAGVADPGAVADAIRWAVHDAGANVVSISIVFTAAGLGVVPGALVDVDEAIQEARAAGALVVVAAGNGHLNAGIPGQPSWLASMGNSPDALVVGASSASGGTPESARYSIDPEVAAHGIAVRTAAATGDGDYVVLSGSSLATPLVAGMAAALRDAAQRAGCPRDAASLEELLLRSARDTALPPSFEGAGFLGARERDAALQHARACTDPPPLAGANEVHATATRAVRSLLADELDPFD